MKKALVILTIAVFTQLFSQTATPPALGDGSQGYPYQIATLENLYWIAADNANWDKYYIQTADINASETSTWFSDGSGGYYGWVTIGDENIDFTGSYDGQDFAVDGLYINRPDDFYIGLFGQTDAAISNISVTNVDVEGYYYVGALAGYIAGTVESCHSSGSVKANSYVGGLIGDNGYGTISECSSSAAVDTPDGDNFSGGLVGNNYKGSIISSHATGDVNGAYFIGGLTGSNYSGTITDSYAEGSVICTGDYSGGLAGDSYKSGTLTTLISNCYATGSIISGDNNVGGLVGHNSGEITSSWYDNESGVVSSIWGWDIGGLVGWNDGEYGIITDCHSNADVTVGSGGGSIGGLVGVNDGTINTSYATGNINAEDDAGGFVGDNYQGTILGTSDNYCYATGTVSGRDYIGSFAGASYVNASMAYCYATGSVSGRDDVGGLAGYNESSTIDHCYSSGSVSGEDKVGGLIGYDYDGNTADSYSSSTVTATGNNAGGLIGYHEIGNVTSCYSEGNVTSPTGFYVGGLIGYSYLSTEVVSDCYSTGDTTGSSTVGGLIGYNEGPLQTSFSTGDATGTGAMVGGLVGMNRAGIENCYSRGNAEGFNYIGGLVGQNYNTASTITNCYSTGTVNGDNTLGGLVGIDYEKGLITDCFWDTVTSGMSTSAGGIGKTTTELMQQTTYTNFDFTTIPVWSIDGTNNDGYAYLDWQVFGSGLTAPQNVFVNYSSTDPELTWDAVDGATSYSILSNSDPYAITGWTTETMGITGTSWTDTEATEAKKFYYVVAVDGN